MIDLTSLQLPSIEGLAGGGGGLAILMNDGNGTFAPPVLYGIVARFITAFDIENDGDVDIVLGTDNREVVVLENDGTGGFVSRNVYQAEGKICGLSASDLDGDGFADLVVRIPFNQIGTAIAALSVLWNDGDGDFPIETRLTGAGTAPGSPTLGDFDGDGTQDIVVTDWTSLSLFFNAGTRNFTPAVPIAVAELSNASIATDVQHADLDGDNDQDLVLALPQTDQILVLKNDGSGQFSSDSIVAVQDFPYFVTPVDIDQDGDIDLLAANRYSGTVSILRNNRSGQFPIVVNIPVSNNEPINTLAADFNGDDRLEISVVTLTGAVTILTNNAGKAVHRVAVDPGSSVLNINFGNVEDDGLGGVDISGSIAGIKFFDFNGNGVKDPGDNALPGWQVFLDLNNNGVLDGGEPVQVTQSNNPDTPTDETGFYKFDSLTPGAYTVAEVLKANWEQTTPQSFSFSSGDYATGDSPQAVAVGDLNGDSIPDLAVANSETNNVSLLLGVGDGTFYAATNVPVGFGPNSVAIGDVDGDSDRDVVVSNRFSKTVTIVRNNGNGTFTALTGIALPDAPAALTLIDYDQDSDLDIAVTIEKLNRVQLLRNNGSGTFVLASMLTVGSAPNGIHTADLEGDGDPDLVVANLESNNISILKNDGSGTFAAALTLAAGRGAFAVTTADVDGDSDLDILSANFLNDTVSWFRNNGGTFAPAVNLPAGRGPASIAATDLELDGDIDLVVGNATSTNISVLINNGTGVFGAPLNFGVGDFPSSLAFAVAVADLDADGDGDLAIANSQASAVSVLRTDIAPGPHRVTLAAQQDRTGINFGSRPVNNPPTLSNLADLMIAEDPGQQSIPLAGITAGSGESQQLQVSANSTNTGLTGTLQIIYVSPSTTGTLRFTPGSNLSGTAVITVTVTDGGTDDDLNTTGDNKSFARSFTVTVTAENDPPTDVSLSANTIAENTNTSSVVAIGTLTASDVDVGDSQNYTLVSGSGSTDNSKFSISGNQLQVNAGTMLNYEAQSSYSIRVRATDLGNAFVERTFTILVTDVNEAPGLPTLSPSSIAENTNTSAGPVEIGMLSAIDPDSGAFANHTFTLVNGAGDADNGRFTISDNKLQIKQNEVINFEAQASYTVRVNVSDGLNNVPQTLTVSVTDVNEAPGLPTLSPSSIAENTNTSAGPVEIGMLSAIDPDSGAFANHTFTLVPGAGDADNGRFTISGNKLQIKQNEVVNFEARASYAIRVNVFDGLNNVPQTLTVSVTDVNKLRRDCRR